MTVSTSTMKVVASLIGGVLMLIGAGLGTGYIQIRVGPNIFVSGDGNKIDIKDDSKQILGKDTPSSNTLKPLQSSTPAQVPQTKVSVSPDDATATKDSPAVYEREPVRPSRLGSSRRTQSQYTSQLYYRPTIQTAPIYNQHSTIRDQTSAAYSNAYPATSNRPVYRTQPIQSFYPAAPRARVVQSIYGQTVQSSGSVIMQGPQGQYVRGGGAEVIQTSRGQTIRTGNVIISQRN